MALPATTHVVQWRGSDVWKVGGKVLAFSGESDDGTPWVTFKVSDIAYEMLRVQQGLRPAPYMASRGLKWIQQYGPPGLTDDELRDYLRQSYRLVAAKLTKKARRELGLGTDQAD